MSVSLGSRPCPLPARLAVWPDLHRRMLGWSQGKGRLQMRSAVRRWAGSKTNEAIVDRRLACTWLTTTPEQLTPDDIFSRIPVAAPDAIDYTPIFLFTPAFARWADTQSTFVEQCLVRFFRNALDRPSQSHIHAVTAIIDRLPYPSESEDTSTNGMEAEGVSILLAKGKNIWAKAAAPRAIRSLETEEPTLLFSLRNGLDDGQAARLPTHEVGLRLANTIFLNGKENTLFGARWAYDSSSKGLKLETWADLSTCSIAEYSNQVCSSLQLPLYPVGERRKVISSMGNILRQIAKHTDATSNEPMPASSELEKELPKYIAENGVADQRVSVWALIEKSSASPYSKAKHSQHSLAEAIQAGATLHRVMSGGGGWGKKQGLLSLDPELSFEQQGDENLKPLHKVLSPNDRASAFGSIPPSDDSMFIQDLSTLSQAAECGDYVQFFASAAEPKPRTGDSTTSHQSEESLSCSFGIMSDVDAVSSQTDKEKDMTIVPNYFGALSGKAITYLQPLGKSKPDTSESRTKIDVPGSRVFLRL